MFIVKKFDISEILSKNIDIYVKIFFRDVGNFFRYLCELVLRHVSNYFVNSFYSVCLSQAVDGNLRRRGAVGIVTVSS